MAYKKKFWKKTQIIISKKIFIINHEHDVKSKQLTINDVLGIVDFVKITNNILV